MPPKKKPKRSRSKSPSAEENIQTSHNSPAQPISAWGATISSSLKDIRTRFSYSKVLPINVSPDAIEMAHPANLTRRIKNNRPKHTPISGLQKKANAVLSLEQLQLPKNRESLKDITPDTIQELIHNNSAININNLISDLEKKRISIQPHNHLVQNTLERLYALILILQKTQNNYSKTSVANCFKAIRLYLLVLHSIQEEKLKTHNAALQIINKISQIIGSVPILNPLPTLSEKFKNANTKGAISDIRRESLFDEEAVDKLTDTLRFLPIDTPTSFSNPIQTALIFRHTTPPRLNQSEYYYCYGDGDCATDRASLEADHLQPAANIKIRLAEFTEAMNASSQFSREYSTLALTQGFKKENGLWECTDEVEKLYLNCLDNLWLIKHSINHAKGDMDPILYLKINSLYGEKFFSQLGEVSQNCILYTINEEILGKAAKQYFRENNALNIQLSEAVEISKIAMRELGIAIDHLPTESIHRKAKNNTTSDLYSALILLSKTISAIKAAFTKRLNGTTDSVTLDTVESINNNYSSPSRTSSAIFKQYSPETLKHFQTKLLNFLLSDTEVRKTVQTYLETTYPEQTCADEKIDKIIKKQIFPEYIKNGKAEKMLKTYEALCQEEGIPSQPIKSKSGLY